MGVSVINGYSEFLPSFGNSYVHHREFKCCVSETEKKTLAKKIHWSDYQSISIQQLESWTWDEHTMQQWMDTYLLFKHNT